MLKHSVDFRGVDKLGRSILHGASVNGHDDLVRILVNAGLDIDVRGGAGETPLHDSGRTGYISVAKTLIDLGANPLTEDNHRRTPRLVAMQNGNEAVAQLLEQKELQLGHGLGETNQSSLSAWSIAAQRRPDLMKALIVHGCDLNEGNPDTGRTALHYAAPNNDVEILEQALQAGAKPDVFDKFNKATLILAAANGGAEGTEALVKYGAGVDIQDYGVIPLSMALSMQHFKVAVVLINAGATIDTYTMLLRPIFFAAVELGDAKAVKILIEHGAKTQVRNSAGYTPLQLAKLHDHPEVMRVLREHKSFFLSSRISSEKSLGTEVAAISPELPIITREPFKARPSKG